MKISYAICVCNESRELYSLVNFLLKVKDDEDDINILVDKKHVTNSVKDVLKFFGEKIVTCEREFDGDFSAHRNYHIRQCSGDYIFILDPDEMPKEMLIKNIKSTINNSEADFIMVPRININLGATSDWLKSHDYTVNELEWINWPDYQGRILKNDPDVIKFGNELHEKVSGFSNGVCISDSPKLALWHIKSVDKDDSRWNDGVYVSPTNEKFYDKLM